MTDTADPATQRADSNKRELPGDEASEASSAAVEATKDGERPAKQAKVEEGTSDEATDAASVPDKATTEDVESSADNSQKDEIAGGSQASTSAVQETKATAASTSAVANVSPAPAPVTATAPLPAGVPVPNQTSYPASNSAAVAMPSALDNQIVEESSEVSALYVGRVIGKGGEMIRDLQARSACRIDVDQNVPPGQPRLITYRGTRKTVEFAKRLVHMLCQENASDADLPLGEAKREFLVIPASSVGKIIGRGGEMIRDLQSRSQAKIQVDHTGHSGLTQDEKQVTITGTDQSVRKAIEMVLFLVANPAMDAIQAINMLCEEKLRTGQPWGTGPPYTGLQNNGQDMQPEPGPAYGGGYEQQGYYGGSGGGGGYGAPQQAVAPQYAAYSAAPPAYQQQQQSYGHYGGGSGGVGGGTEIEIFYAAKNYMGRIIGQKGCTINDIQRRSACDIQINQDVPPGQDCQITIKGSRPGIETAKKMLCEIIEIGPNHPYAGGNYNQGAQGGYGQQSYGQQSYGGYQQQSASYGQSYGQQQQQSHDASAYGGGYQAQGGAYGGQQYGQAPQAYAAPAVTASDWKAATAPDGQIYYYNQRTGETQWEKPMGMA